MLSPTTIVPSIPFQLFAGMLAVINDQIIFSSRKCFGLVDNGQRHLAGNTAVGKKECQTLSSQPYVEYLAMVSALFHQRGTNTIHGA